MTDAPASPAEVSSTRPGGIRLGCAGLTRRFGGVLAVDQVSLQIDRSGVFGLCGFNGAGKSTLFDLLAGAVRPDAGSVVLNGREVTALGSAQRYRLGLARTWQLVRLAGGRTVLDNVAAGAVARPGQSLFSAFFRPGLAEARARAGEVLGELGLVHLAGQLAGNLTLEGQRLTELARALASRPEVILADEPASGLSAAQRQVLAGVLQHLGETRTVVVVEHDLDLLTGIAQHVWAMVSGRIAFEGDATTFLASEVYSSLRGLRG